MTALDSQVAELQDTRRKLSLDAAEGDKASVKSIVEVASQIASLDRERETFVTAVEQAEALKADQQRKIEAEDRKVREAQARAISDDVVKLNEKIDATMIELRTLLETRSTMIQKMTATRVVPSRLVLRLLQKHGPTAAAHAAGVRKHIALDHIPPDQIVSPLKATASYARGRSPLLATVTRTAKCKELRHRRANRSAPGAE